MAAVGITVYRRQALPSDPSIRHDTQPEFTTIGAEERIAALIAAHDVVGALANSRRVDSAAIRFQVGAEAAGQAVITEVAAVVLPKSQLGTVEGLLTRAGRAVADRVVALVGGHAGAEEVAVFVDFPAVVLYHRRARAVRIAGPEGADVCGIVTIGVYRDTTSLYAIETIRTRVLIFCAGVIDAGPAGPFAAIAVIAATAVQDAGPIGTASLAGPIATDGRPVRSLATWLGTATVTATKGGSAFAAEGASIRHWAARRVATALGAAALRLAGTAAFVLRFAEDKREVAAEFLAVAAAKAARVIAAFAMGRSGPVRITAIGTAFLQPRSFGDHTLALTVYGSLLARATDGCGSGDGTAGGIDPCITERAADGGSPQSE